MIHRLLGLVVFILLTSLTRPAPGQSPDTNLFQIAFVESAFRTVNKNDAVAAVTVWAEHLLQRRGIIKKGVVRLYPTVEALAEGVRAGQADVISVSAAHYLTLSGLTEVDPVFLATKRGSPGDRYLLLTRQKDALTRLSELDGREILLQNVGHLHQGREWLHALARAEGLPQPAWTVTEVDKVLNALMPVFMGQKPACLVVRSAYETACEMNPQLAKALVPLRQSDEMMNATLALRRSFTDVRAETMEELAALHESSYGQQILTLLKYERLVPFDEAAMASARDFARLIAEHPEPLVR